MVEAGLGVDATIIARRPQLRTIDETLTPSAHLAIEAGLIAASTVGDVQIGVDASTVAVAQARVRAASSSGVVTRGDSFSTGVPELRWPAEFGVCLPAPEQRHQREQDPPPLFLSRQRGQLSPVSSAGSTDR